MHCLISWRNCPMSHDRSLLPSTLYSWCPCARQRWVTSAGCTGMMGILSISQIRLIFLTPRSFYLLLTSVFPLTCLPFTFPLSSSHPHCSSSPQFPFIPTSQLASPPTNHIYAFSWNFSLAPTTLVCHLVSRVLSLSLSPPTECWPLVAWCRSFMCFHSHHTQSGN